MKRIFALFVCIFFVSLSQTALAQNFSNAQLKKMSTFLSNFTETRMFNFNVQQFIDEDNLDAFINFGVEHNIINYWGKRAVVKEGSENMGMVEGQWVKEAVKKYFAYDLKKLDATLSYSLSGSAFMFPLADGEAVFYARVTNAETIASKLVVMKGYIYNAETEEKTGQTFVAVTKPYKFNGVDTWCILSLTTTEI